MKLVRNTADTLVLELTELELMTLKACLRESFALLDRRDFPLRVGVQIEVAANIADELGTLMQGLGVDE